MLEVRTLTPFAFCREAIENRQIVLKTSGFQKRNFISVLDVAKFIEEIVPKIDQLSLVHLAGKDTFSIRELASMVQITLKNKFDLNVDLIFGNDYAEYSDFNYDSLYQGKIFMPTHRLQDFIEYLCASLMEKL